MALDRGSRRAVARIAGVVVICGALVACSLEPRYLTPPLAVDDAWPIPTTSRVVGGDGADQSTRDADIAMSDVGWSDFFVDEELQALIAQALAHNRDLRTAILSVEGARAQYRVQAAESVPFLTAEGDHRRERHVDPEPDSPEVEREHRVTIGIPAFELDLFGRVRSLRHAALDRYLAQEETRRSAQLALVAEVASAYLTLASDRQSQQLARDTLRAQQDSFAMTEKRHELGAASALDVARARTTVESARADVARFEGNVAQDVNALTLLVGATVDETLLPASLDATVSGVKAIPPGLPSTVLLRRPDVLAAEHALRAANANIGAARAALFPTISLTGTRVDSSERFGGLFEAGSGSWVLASNVVFGIFEGGRKQANLDASHVDRKIALAQYEKAIQVAFREVADGLALSASLSREHAARETLVLASTRAYELSQARYKAGRDSYLDVLDAQRSQYAAQQGLIAVRLAEQRNRVSLYKSLGGGWLERSR